MHYTTARSINVVPSARFIVAVLPALLLALAGGCRRPPPQEALPTYEGLDETAALEVLAARARAIRTTSAEVGLTLTRTDGQSVQFDGAMITRPPAELRLQTFKFNRTVFDLTLNPQGMFVKTMDDPSRRDQIIPASQSAARFAREWAMFSGGLFEEPDLQVSMRSRQQLVVRRMLGDGRTIVCLVHRPTLTPRRYGLLDPTGVERFSLAVSDYRTYDGVVHPTHLFARSEQGTIDIRIRDMEINVDPPGRAFDPPAGAENLGDQPQ